MTLPPSYDLRDLGPQAQMMARNCNNERLAMTHQYVAIGSMVIMAGASATNLLKELFTHTERQDKSR